MVWCRTGNVHWNVFDVYRTNSNRALFIMKNLAIFVQHDLYYRGNAIGSRKDSITDSSF